MYSDMSKRTNAWSELKRYDAKAFANSVLPTPVGLKNMNEATGPSDRRDPHAALNGRQRKSPLLLDR